MSDNEELGTGSGADTGTGNTDAGNQGNQGGNQQAGGNQNQNQNGGGNQPYQSFEPKPFEFDADWRDRMAAGLPNEQRSQAQNYLRTRTSPYEVLRAGINADAEISRLKQERVKIPTGQNDDPRDIEAYRKARGVPEAPDKYEFKLPDGFQLSDRDQQLKSDFLKRAHGERNWNQQDVDFALETHLTILKEMEAEKAALAVQRGQAARDELMVEWGRDYHANVELTNRMFEEEFRAQGITDPNERRAILSKRFDDGTAIGENPQLVKAFASLARKLADDGAFIVGETNDGVDLNTKIDNIIKLRDSDPKEYERMQPELMRLVAAQNRINDRKR